MLFSTLKLNPRWFFAVSKLESSCCAVLKLMFSSHAKFANVTIRQHIVFSWAYIKGHLNSKHTTVTTPSCLWTRLDSLLSIIHCLYSHCWTESSAIMKPWSNPAKADPRLPWILSIEVNFQQFSCFFLIIKISSTQQL